MDRALTASLPRMAFAAVFLATAFSLVALVLGSRSLEAFHDDDSVVYLEAAGSLAAGEGLEVQGWGWRELERRRGPLSVFPPGYPAAAAALIRLGVPAENAVILLPRIAYLLLPLAFLLVLRHVLSKIPAAISVILIAGLAAPLVFAVQAMSEIPYLLLTTLGFAATFASWRSGRASTAVLAGILGGLALGVRNAGYVAPLAVAVGWAFARFSGALPVPDARKFALRYVVGFVIAYSPVLGRNLLTFGWIQPYSAGWDATPLREVLRESVSAIEFVFLGGLLPPIGFALCGLALLFAAVWLLRRRGWMDSSRAGASIATAAGTTLAAYGLLGLGLVIASRTLLNVDPIGDRFLLQYEWLGVALVVWWVSSGLRSGATGAVVSILLVVALGAGQTRGFRAARSAHAGLEAALGKHEPLRAIIEGIPDDSCVVATFGPRLRHRFGREIFQLDDVTPEELGAMVGERCRLIVLLYPTDDPELSDWNVVFTDGAAPPGYRELARHDLVVALEFVAD